MGLKTRAEGCSCGESFTPGQPASHPGEIVQTCKKGLMQADSPGLDA